MGSRRRPRALTSADGRHEVGTRAKIRVGDRLHLSSLDASSLWLLVWASMPFRSAGPEEAS